MWCPPNIPPLRLYFLDKNGWPVEQFYRQPIRNLIRLLLHTRRISTKWVVSDVSWIHGTTTWPLDDLVRLCPLVMEPPIIRSDLSQKGFMSTNGFRILNDRPIIPMGLVGPIDDGADDTENLMGPEDDDAEV